VPLWYIRFENDSTRKQNNFIGYILKCLWFLFIAKCSKNTKEHNVLETGSVSVLRGGVGDNYSVGSVKKRLLSALSNRPNGVGILHPSPEDRIRSNFQNFLFLCVF
jgi:hypothetical protein